jgi:hypothetical protein
MFDGKSGGGELVTPDAEADAGGYPEIVALVT